jgi:outer membrane protein assembly factor BamE (lipoprotein component of BamABCDE complex)
MKKLMMALAAATMLAACTKNDEPEASPSLKITIPSDSIETHATINFCFGGDVAITGMTRATLAEINLTDVWVFDYVGGQLQATTHQTASDASFGSPSLTVDYGDHTFYFVASRGDTPTIDGTTISWAKPSDTFWATLSLTVAPGSSITQAVSLHRVAARLRITVTDEIPTTLASLSVTPSHWYYGLDYLTGDAADDRQTARTVNVPASYVGTRGQLVASFFTISPSTQWTTDVTLTATATDNSMLSSINIKDVPMQRNHVTSYGGSILNAGRSITLQSDEEWIEDAPVTW